MVAVRMVQVSIDEVVDVVAVRDSFVAAIGAMYVPIFVAAACVTRCARIGILLANRERMLFDDSVLTLMVEVPVV